MAQKFQLQPLVGTEAFTYRVGTTTEPLTEKDRGKAVTLGAENQMVLADADDVIYGFLSSVEPGTMDGYVLGGVQEQDFHEVDTTGLDVGDLVVVESNPVRGTQGKTKVKKATDTPIIVWVVVRSGLIKRL